MSFPFIIGSFASECSACKERWWFLHFYCRRPLKNFKIRNSSPPHSPVFPPSLPPVSVGERSLNSLGSRRQIENTPHYSAMCFTAELVHLRASPEAPALTVCRWKAHKLVSVLRRWKKSVCGSNLSFGILGNTFSCTPTVTERV